MIESDSLNSGIFSTSSDDESKIAYFTLGAFYDIKNIIISPYFLHITLNVWVVYVRYLT